MDPMHMLEKLAAATRLDEMRGQLASFNQTAPWYSRYCTYIRSSILSIGVDEVYALSDRISCLVLENPALVHDPRALTYLSQIERKLYPNAPPNFSIFSASVCKELLQENSLYVQDSSISLKVLERLLESSRCAAVSSVEVRFQDSTASIPVALVKEACASYPDDTLAMFITARSSEQLIVNGHILLVTLAVLQRFYSFPGEIIPGEPSCYPFPEISPTIVIHFINTLIKPDVYLDGHPNAYIRVDNKGQITIRPLLREYVTLIDYLLHPASTAQLKHTLLHTLDRALDAQDVPTAAQVRNIFLLMELLVQHEAVIAQSRCKALQKYVAKFFSQDTGISISTVEQLGNTAIPFEGLQVAITTPSSLFSAEHTFRAVQTQSIIGHKSLSSDEALFCYYANGRLFFLPQLAKNALDTKVEVKVKDMTFLLSSKAAHDPVWKRASFLSSQECIQIAQVLEETKEIEIREAVNLVATAKMANSRTLYQAALSQVFMAAQKQQESTTFKDLYKILEALKKLRQTVYTAKDCTHLYSIAEYMIARCIQSTALPERVQDGFAPRGNCWQSQAAEYYNGGPLYNYDSPRERIQSMCNDLNLRQLHLQIDQNKAAEGLQALNGFTTIESVTITLDPDYIIPPRFLRSIKHISALKMLRLQGFCRAGHVPYTLAEATQMLQLPQGVQLVVE